MVQVRTSPQEHSLLMFEARKSASFGVYFTDAHDNPLDVSTATVTIAVSHQNRAVNQAPVLTVTAEPRVDIGWKRFNIQASQLSMNPGPYDFTMTVILEGYSFVPMKGTLELVDNGDLSATSSTFTIPSTTTNLKVALKPASTVVVSLTDMLLPIPTAAVEGGGGGGGDIPVTDAELLAIFNDPGSAFRAAVLAAIDAKIAEIEIPTPEPAGVQPADVYAFRVRTGGGTGAWEPANRGDFKGIVWLGADPSSSEQEPQDLRSIPAGS